MDGIGHGQAPLVPSLAAAAAIRAIAVAGGGAKLARAIGVTKFAVYQWQATGIPAARLPAVERITGIPMRELRPDLWDFSPASAG